MIESEGKIPVWVAVLCSFGLPIVVTFFIIIVKHANEVLVIKAADFTIAYWGIMSLVFQIFGAVSFY